MQIILVKDYQEMSQELNKQFIDQIKLKPESVLGFTTGGTPKGMAKHFAQEINNGLDVSEVTIVNLDEYVCEPETSVFSVYNWMMTHVFEPIHQDFKAFHILKGNANKQEELTRFKKVLEDNPRDIQMLGLGTNAHIGANEPGTPFDQELFVADSHESTIQAVINLFGISKEEAPTQMFTMGFKEIMEAKKVVLAASGKSKAQAVKAILEEEIDVSIPASILKTHHNFVFIIDDEAASLLDN